MKTLFALLTLTLLTGSIARADEVATYYVAVVHPAENDERYACAFSVVGVRPRGFEPDVLVALPVVPPAGGKWGLFRFGCWFSDHMSFDRWERLVWYEFGGRNAGFINTAFRADEEYTEQQEWVRSYEELLPVVEHMIRAGCYCGGFNGGTP